MEDGRGSSRIFVLDKTRIYEPEQSFTEEQLAGFEEKDIFRDESRQFYFARVLFDLTRYPSRGTYEEGMEDYKISCGSLHELAVELFENGARGLEDVVFMIRAEKIEYYGWREEDERVAVYRDFTKKDVEILEREMRFMRRQSFREEYRDQPRLFS